MGRSLNLVEDEDTISQTLRLLRITLLGPIREELLDWRTETKLSKAWITASGQLARLRLETPQLNYVSRNLRMQDPSGIVDWQLRHVDILH